MVGINVLMCFTGAGEIAIELWKTGTVSDFCLIWANVCVGRRLHATMEAGWYQGVRQTCTGSWECVGV